MSVKQTEPYVIDLKNERNWPLRHYDLAPYFGVKSGHHWPDEGIEGKLIGNVWVWVLPKPEPTKRAWHPRGVPKSSKHRVMCRCPRCNATIPAGRLHQHIDTDKCYEARAKLEAQNPFYHDQEGK